MRGANAVLTAPARRTSDITVDATYFGEMRERLAGVLRMVQDVSIRVSLSDRFLQELAQLVAENPSYETSQNLVRLAGAEPPQRSG